MKCLIALLVAAFCLSVDAYPFHASCTVNWVVGLPCASVSTKLKNQMALWTTRKYCPNSGSNNKGKTLGEKCLYDFVSATSTLVQGHHFTPVENYRDTFSYKLSSQGANSCAVQGSSSSDTWYAYLDLGTNYCNIANLVYGSGMDKTSGFSESTSTSICTQYDKRNCTIY